MRYAGYKNGGLVFFNNSGVTSTYATQYGQIFVYDVSGLDVTNGACDGFDPTMTTKVDGNQ
jgi:hypothetical protein